MPSLLIHGTHGALDRLQGKSALQEKTHLLGAFGRVSGSLLELFAPYLPGALSLIAGKVGLDFANGVGIDAMILKFREDAAVAEACGPAVDKGFGKALLRQELRCFERIKQGLDVIPLLRVAGELAP